MLSMAKEKDPPRVYYRTTRRAESVMKAVWASMRGTKRFARRGSSLPQEQFINGVFLWIATLDPEELAEKLGPHIEGFEQEWKAANSEELSGATVEHHQVIPPAEPKRRKAK